MRRLATLAVAAIAGGGLVVGCGQTPQSIETAAPLGASVLSFDDGARADMASAAFEGSLRLPAAEAPLPAGEIAFAGTYDLAAQESTMTAELLDDGSDGGAYLAGALGPIEIRVVDDRAYVTGGPVALLGGGGWLAVPAAPGSDSGADAPLLPTPPDPGEMLDHLADTDGVGTELGRDTVRGVGTRHVRVEIRPDDAWTALGRPDRSLPGGSGHDPELQTVDDAVVELWIDDEGRIRRLDLHLAAEGATGPAAMVDGATLTVELFSFGDVPAVVAPDPAEVTPLDGFDLDGFDLDG